MEILVCIPDHEYEHVMATKLNRISSLTHGYWTLSGCPRFTKRGERIWFANTFGEVIASAKILIPRDSFPEGCERVEDEPEDGRFKPAVCFDITTVMGHEFDTPRELPPRGFRGFRYVRRASKYVSAKRTQALEVVGAETAQRLHPRNW